MSEAAQSQRLPEPASQRISRPANEARAAEVMPGVWSLRLPLCYVPMTSVNAYLLAADDGWILWDCGTALPPTWNALLYAIIQAGAAPVTTLIVSHAHVDHRGLAAEVVARTGARLLSAAGPHPFIDALRDPHVPLADRHAWARRDGVPEAALAVMCDDLPGDDRGCPPAVEDAVLAPGHEVVAASGTWEVIALPGHSADQIGLWHAATRTLLSADLAFPGVPSFLEYGTRPDPHADQLASLDRAIALRPELLLPGHGKPVAGDAVETLEACRALVTERVDRVLAALGDGAETGWEVALALTPDGASGDAYQRGQAEGLCVLEHLEQREVVASTLDEAGVRRWRAVAAGSGRGLRG